VRISSIASVSGRLPISTPAALRKAALAASEQNDLRAQLELEAEHQAQAFLSDDAAERIAAFLQKRP